MTDFRQTRTDPAATDAALAQAIALWRQAIGDDGVLLGAAAAEFSDPYTAAEMGFNTSVVLQPASIEQIQAIVRIANETGISLWVNSQGRNNGYGGGAAVTAGTVVVNLRRMNRVLEINDELCYVVVEPGVSYRDLYDEVQRQDKQILVDLPDLSWGSVVGNALDHGGGATEYWDHAASLCGLEVVLPNGEIVRTGMGAMADNTTWHLSRRGFGPQLDAIFTQSNYGIVTKAGLWMMPKPQTYACAFVKVERDEDLERLVETMRPFLLDRTLCSCPVIFNSIGTVATLMTRSDVWPGDGPIPPSEANRIGAEVLGLGAWNLELAIYGDQIVVERNLQRIEEAFADFPGATFISGFIPQEALHPGNTELNQKQKVHGGVPDLSMLKILEWSGGKRGGHLDFSAVVPLTGRDVRKIVDLTRTTLTDAGSEYFVGIALAQRYAVQLNLLLFDVDNAEETNRQYRLYAELVRLAAAEGYGEYRCHTGFMDLVSAQYDFNDSALLRMAETIKDALDPAGILAPGKQGIWPERFRVDDSRLPHNGAQSAAAVAASAQNSLT